MTAGSPGDAPGGGTRFAATLTPTWVLRHGFSAGVTVAILLATAGLLLARIDLVLLAIPLVVGAAWAWDHRPDREAATTVVVQLDDAPTIIDDGTARGVELGYTVNVEPPPGTDTVALRLTGATGIVVELVMPTPAAWALRGRARLPHSGPQAVVRVEHNLGSADAALLTLPSPQLVAGTVVRPGHEAITSLPLPRNLQGLTGGHISRRLGDGGDFRDVHPFSPGDRLRRVDWKATARHGQFSGDLYVRRTTATADATVVVVLDSRDDVGHRVADWRKSSATVIGATSLDVAREAASSIAAGYIRGGDRVGFQDLATRTRMIVAGGGERHLSRLLRVIERTRPISEPLYRMRPPIVTPGALLFVLSTFLDDGAARMATLWRAAGHRVIAVDVLPPSDLTGASRFEAVAFRIVMMERADRMRSLTARGIENLRWLGDSGVGTPNRTVRLRALTRASAGRR